MEIDHHEKQRPISVREMFIAIRVSTTPTTILDQVYESYGNPSYRGYMDVLGSLAIHKNTSNLVREKIISQMQEMRRTTTDPLQLKAINGIEYAATRMYKMQPIRTATQEYDLREI